MTSDRKTDPERSRGSLIGKVPSWMVSVAVHVVIVIVFAWNLDRFSGGDPGPVDGDFREVGLYVKSDSNSEEFELESSDSETESETQPDTPATDSQKSFQETSKTDAPPIDIQSPLMQGPVIGPGAAAAPNPVPSSNPLDNVVKTGGVRAPSAPSRRGDNATEFFGIRDAGDTFVYVLDRSSSMLNSGREGPSKIQIAKAELIASLKSLNPKQRFQVIFYNRDARSLSLAGSSTKAGLYWATDVNLSLAEQQIRAVVPNLGTRPMPALVKAIELKPDVVFFLTDSDTEAELSGGDLVDLLYRNRKENGGNTRVHTIEFGEEGESLRDTPLKRIAREHNGTYRYRKLGR